MLEDATKPDRIAAETERRSHLIDGLFVAELSFPEAAWGATGDYLNGEQPELGDAMELFGSIDDDGNLKGPVIVDDRSRLTTAIRINRDDYHVEAFQVYWARVGSDKQSWNEMRFLDDEAMDAVYKLTGEGNPLTTTIGDREYIVVVWPFCQ